jgi:ATP-dependent protease ClpP protease subunit
MDMNNQPLPVGQPIPPEVVYVSFPQEISPQTTETLMAVLANLVEKGARRIVLMISSPGGSVMSGLTLYEFI